MVGEGKGKGEEREEAGREAWERTGKGRGYDVLTPMLAGL